MKLTLIRRQGTFLLLYGFTMILFLAGCGGDSATGGGGGGGCAGSTCFGGGGGGGGSQNPDLSVAVAPGDGKNVLTLTLSSGTASSFNLYWSTSPDTTTATWTKIEGVARPFTHDGLTNGTPIFYGATSVSGGRESDPSAVVGGMPGRWTKLTPSGSLPPTRDSHTAVYDSTSDRMIVFGGRNSNLPLNDYWVLKDAAAANVAWSAVPTSSPKERLGHTAVYNDQSNLMTIFGGSFNSTGSALISDLWRVSNADALAGVQWNSQGSAGPSARWGHAAVYDEASDTMVVFGGSTGTGQTMSNEVWVLDRATTVSPGWRALAPSGGPSVRCCMAVSYDSENRRMILFGGSGFNQSGSAVFGDLWTLTFNAAFTTATWQELTPSVGTAPSARCCAASLWDGSKLLLFGGGAFDSSSDDKIYALVLDSSTFASAVGPAGGPTARTFPSAVPAGRFLLFGGADGSGPLNDLWRLE